MAQRFLASDQSDKNGGRFVDTETANEVKVKMTVSVSLLN